MPSLLSKLALSICVVVLGAATVLAQPKRDEEASLNKMIEHFRKLESSRSRIIADLEAGRLTLMNNPPERPTLMRNDEIRDQCVFESLLNEAERSSPNFQLAIADGERIAQNFIRNRQDATRAYLKRVKGELSSFRTSRQKLERRLEELRAKPPAKLDIAGTWRTRIENPYAWYEYRWTITSTGSDTWKIEQTLLDTSHGFHNQMIGKRFHDYTLVKNGAVYEIRGEEVDKNPGNPGSFTQTGSLTLKDDSLAGEGVHKGTALTHWIKFSAKRAKD